jgi:hypothetical protein
MALAVGDDQSTHPILQSNNGCISLFNRTGQPRYARPKALESLFNAPGVKIFDPRALYDWENKRYVIVATEKDDDGKIPGHYWIAVSASTDSAGPYYVHRLPMPSGGDNAFADFPRVGQDRHHVYLASNKFSVKPKSVFQYEEWLMLPKVWLYEGSGVQYRYFYDTKVLNLTTDTSQPANIWNPADSPELAYFVSSKAIKVGGGLQCDIASPCNGLFVWAILANQASPYMKPVVSGLLVQTAHNYVTPGFVTQKVNFPLGGFDTRLSGQVTYSAGSLYASLNTRDNAGRSSALLFKIVPAVRDGLLVSAAITDEALLDWGQNSTLLATSQPDAHGNTIAVFNVSGPNYNPSTAYVLRSNGQFSNPAIVVRPGEAPFYNQDGWGDYTAVAPDAPHKETHPSPCGSPEPTLWTEHKTNPKTFWTGEQSSPGSSFPRPTSSAHCHASRAQACPASDCPIDVLSVHRPRP